MILDSNWPWILDSNLNTAKFGFRFQYLLDTPWHHPCICPGRDSVFKFDIGEIRDLNLSDNRAL